MIKTVRLFILSISIFIFQEADAQLFSEHQVLVDGTFSADMHEVKAADFDNDGDLDIVTYAFNRHQVVWYENMGDKQFSPRKIISQTLRGTVSLDIGDFDNDGYTDIVAVSAGLPNEPNYLDKTVWYKNNGDGSFSEEDIISTNADNPQKVRVLDVNNDGKLDVIVGSISDDKLAWYENVGDGEWGLEQIIATDLWGSDFSLGDLDGDGQKDIIYRNRMTNTLTWRKKLSSGVFTLPINIGEFNNHSAMHAVDIDLDGDIDVLAAISTPGQIGVVLYENEGLGNMGLAQEIITNNEYYNVMDAQDINQDGLIDLVLGYDDKVVLFPNLGSNTFGEELVISESAMDVNDIIIADLDADNDYDLLSTSRSDYKVAWYENLGGNNFEQERRLTYDVNRLEDFTYADVDMDGLVDVLSALSAPFDAPSYKVFAWYKNLGAEGFSGEKIINTDSSLDVSPTAIHTVDLDQDGLMDVIGGNSNKLEWYKNMGNGVFSNPLPILENTFGSVRIINSKDIDSDGDIDFVINLNNSSIIQVVKNDGLNDFELVQTIDNSNYSVYDLQLEDIDNDSDMDIVFISGGQSKLAWHANDGSGNYGAEQIISTNFWGIGYMTLADFNNDELVDIIAISFNDNKVSLYTNQGSGMFSSQQVLFTGNFSRITSGDLDQDGWDDIVLSGSSNKIQWYKNFGNSAFEWTESIENNNESNSDLALVDLDNDTDLDLVYEGFFFGPFSYSNIGYANNTLVDCPPVETNTTDVIILEGETYTLPDGEIVSTTGTYTTITENSEGCTTQIITTNLIVCPTPIEFNEEVVIQEGESYTLPDGVVVTEPALYTTIIEDQNGCEIEIYFTQLILCSNPVESSSTVIINMGESFTFPDGQVISEAGIYTFMVEDDNGCVTEIITVELIVCAESMETTVEITINQGEFYMLPDSTTVTEAGTYTTEIYDDNGCLLEVITTILDVMTSTNNLLLQNEIQLSPNPTTTQFLLEIGTSQVINHNLVLTNILGQEVYQQVIHNNKTHVDTSDLMAGTYWVQIRDLEGSLMAVEKLVVLR